MKTIIAAALAATAVVAASAPAMAQPYGPPPHERYGPPPSEQMDIDQRIDRMQVRINRARLEHRIARIEVDRAQAELNSIRSEERRDRLNHWGKLRGGDRDHLNQRLDRLGATLHWMRKEGHRRPW